MKKIYLFVLAACLLASACKKNETTPSYDSQNSPLMKIMDQMDDSMKDMTMTMDPDYDFAMMMKQHHIGAINMANYELANGSDNTIKGMAQTMKDAQAMEISTLDSFMMAYHPSGMNMMMMDSLNASTSRMSTQARAQQLKGQSDHDFAHLMIVHHMSAIDMAKAELKYGTVDMMKNMAQMMITDQTKEINDMQAWLNEGHD